MLTTVLIALAEPAAPLPCAGQTLADATASYAESMRAGDHAQIERVYGRSGTLSVLGGTPHRGGQAIARYLAGFRDWQLVEASFTIRWVERARQDWRVRGTFRQRGTSPDGVAYTTDGQFSAVWRCEKAGWRLRRMATNVADPVLS